MDRSLLSGLFWTALGKWFTQVLTWASTLAVARILAPDDFGILAMALVFLGLVYLVNEFGLSAAVIHNHSISDEVLSKVASAAVLMGCFLAVLTIALSGAIAGFFKEPEIQLVIIVLSGTLVLSGVQVVPRGLLTRELSFRTLAIVDGSQALAAAIVTLILAIVGMGYWSLVLGNVFAKVVATAMVLKVRYHPWGPLSSPREILPELRFGAHMALANVGWYLYGNADAVVIGRILGVAPLGAYGIASNIASAPISQVSALLARVTSGVFASVQADAQAISRYVLNLTQAQTFLTFPAAAGIALVAPELVHTVLGSQWSSAIVPLQLLSLCAMLRCLAPIPVQALVYTGHPDLNTRITLLGAGVLPLLFILGAHWGVNGVAMAWLIGYGGFVLPTVLYFMRSRLGVGFASFGKYLMPPVVCTSLMVTAVVAIHWAMPADAPSYLVLLAKVAAGVVSYSLVLFTVFRERISALRHLIHTTRNG